MIDFFGKNFNYKHLNKYTNWDKIVCVNDVLLLRKLLNIVSQCFRNTLLILHFYTKRGDFFMSSYKLGVVFRKTKL